MKDGHVEIDAELTLYYREAGQGDQTILLLPGWTMSTSVFERQLSYFETSTDFRFITFDPRAHGRSSNTESGHTYEQHGRDLQAFIEKLGLNKIILGGWSFGTLAALAYLNQFGSDRLHGFIMLDGPPCAVGVDNRKDWVTYRYDDADGSQKFFSWGRLVNPEQTNREFASWMLEEKSEDNIRWLLDITGQTPDIAAVLLNATSVFLDYRDDLIALEGKLPLLYVLRRQQREIVTDWGRRHTPSARILAFGEHMMFWERADKFNRVLVEFARQ